MHALKRIPIGIAAGMVRRVDEVPLELAEMIDHITFGSFTLHGREGNTGMTYHFDQATGASYNAINLKNLGLLWFLVNELPKVVPLRERGCKIRVSLAPLTPEELVQMILMIMRFEHLVHLVDEWEINFACPNHKDARDQLHPVLAKDPLAVRAFCKVMPRSHLLRLAMKISYKTEHSVLVKLLNIAVEFGFHTMVSGNTDRIPREQVPDVTMCAHFCGMGGAPLLEAGIEQVSELHNIIDRQCEVNSMTKETAPRIIACGGISEPDHLRRYLGEGAVSGQMATPFWNGGPRALHDFAVSYALTED